jgi:hypothetical protein
LLRLPTATGASSLKRFISLALFAVSLISSRLLDAQAFQNPYRIPTNGDPVGVFYADVNGDGIPDILYEDDSVGAVRILFGQPGGGTVAGPSLILPTTLVECRPLDANNDGKLDLVCLSLIDTFDVSALYPLRSSVDGFEGLSRGEGITLQAR